MTDDSEVSRESESDISDDERDEVASMYDQPAGGSGADSTPISYESGSDGVDGDGDSTESESSSGAGGPLLGDDDQSPEPEAGTFYVKHAKDTAVTLHEVNTSQIYTLIENPGVEAHDILEATLVAQPPMEVSYLVDELEERRQIPIEDSPEPPTRQVQTAAEKMEPMQAVALDREGEGEIHVLTVDPDSVERTVEELYEDEMTYKNAARYGVGRVEIRSDADEGIVSIRYLP